MPKTPEQISHAVATKLWFWLHEVKNMEVEPWKKSKKELAYAKGSREAYKHVMHMMRKFTEEEQNDENTDG